MGTIMEPVALPPERSAEEVKACLLYTSVGGRHRVRRAGGRAGGQAHGPAGQAHAGEGVR